LESGYRLVTIDEKAVNQFHRDQSVNLRSVISALVKVAANDFLDTLAIPTWPRERTLVEEHFA
jgi:hypothetical protein